LTIIAAACAPKCDAGIGRPSVSCPRPLTIGCHINRYPRRLTGIAWRCRRRDRSRRIRGRLSRVRFRVGCHAGNRQTTSKQERQRFHITNLVQRSEIARPVAKSLEGASIPINGARRHPKVPRSPMPRNDPRRRSDLRTPRACRPSAISNDTRSRCYCHGCSRHHHSGGNRGDNCRRRKSRRRWQPPQAYCNKQGRRPRNNRRHNIRGPHHPRK
jgi:hypothetical protein